MDLERNQQLLKSFPKKTTDVPEKFRSLKFTEPTHLIGTSLAYRKLAKIIAIDFVHQYLNTHICKYPPIYLTKASFIKGYRDSSFNNSQILEKWNKASVVVLDGIDEANNANEMNWLASFLSPLITEKKPLILISSNNLTEARLQEFGAMSFGVQLLDVKVINLNE